MPLPKLVMVICDTAGALHAVQLIALPEKLPSDAEHVRVTAAAK
jgi:hypothetical protein